VVRRNRNFSKKNAQKIQLEQHCESDALTSEIKSLGDWSDGGTPGLISNPAVKPVSANGTWGAAPWESRSSPRDFSYLIDINIFLNYNLLRVAGQLLPHAEEERAYRGSVSDIGQIDR
jgi:hypothetical protein